MSKNKLTETQKAAISLLLSGVKYKTVSEKLGISRTELWKWRKQNEFVEEFERQRLEIASEVKSKLAALFEKAVDTLSKGMGNEEALKVLKIFAGKDGFDFENLTSIQEKQNGIAAMLTRRIET